MKYSDTNLGEGEGGSLDAKTQLCGCPTFPAVETPRLPALPLSSTNSPASPVFLPPRRFLSFISSPSSSLSTPPPQPLRHSLYRRMAASKIRAKQSQHSREHLFRIAVRSLALVLHFTFDFSVGVRGMPLGVAGVWRATKGVQNARVELELRHMLHTLFL